MLHFTQFYPKGAPGISEQGRRLLVAEWNKNWNLLKHHLLVEFGNASAAEKRQAELNRLIEFVFYIGRRNRKFLFVCILEFIVNYCGKNEI